MNRWRLILDDDRPAAFNMAADAELLRLAEKKDSRPVLRIYSWEEPSITIGYHQKVDNAIDVDKIAATPVVRRITGGRALLHDSGELTYAIAGDYRRFRDLGQTLSQSYLYIARALIRFYASLGWQAKISTRQDRLIRAGSRQIQKGCFASVSRYEIIAFGQKVAASSQRRTRTAFLQHGAVRFTRVASHPAIKDSDRNSTEADPLPAITLSRSELVNLLIESCASIFETSFDKIPYDGPEQTAIRRLIKQFKISINS